MVRDWTDSEFVTEAISQAAEFIRSIATDQRPLGAGLVLGAGGTGIQVVSRARYRVRRAPRPTRTIQFLGIDAVPLDRQTPALPPGCTLEAPREFLNVTGRGFRAAQYLASNLAHDENLKRSWDDRYHPPVQGQEHGMKRVRPLGRLATYASLGQIEAVIADAVTTARAIERDLVDKGVLPEPSENFPVYYVSSAVGGYGSGGTLDILHRVWKVLTAQQLVPEIRAFFFQPGVYESVVRRQPSWADITAAHKANAYAFFREIDYFATHSEALDAFVSDAATGTPVHIPDESLFKQVFVIDKHLGNLGIVTDPRELFEVVAEAISHFLVTPLGQPLVGEEGTNIDEVLLRKDRYGKRRLYSGVGVARALYPSETIWTHLVHRFMDDTISRGLVGLPPDIDRQLDRDASLKTLTAKLVESTAGVDEASSATSGFLSHVNSFAQALAVAAVGKRTQAATTAVAELEAQLPTAREAFARTAQGVIPGLLEHAEQSIEAFVNTCPGGAQYARAALTRLAAALATEADVLSAEQATQQDAANDAWHQILETRERLARGEHGMLKRVKSGSAARDLGHLLVSWAQGGVRAEALHAQDRYMRVLVERVREMIGRLHAGVEVLTRLASRARDVWIADVLVGADAGPVKTSVLFPTDLLPEVEESAFTRSVYEEVMEKADMRELAHEVLTDWATSPDAGHGLLSLGATGSEALSAERSLRATLSRVAQRRFRLGANPDGEEHLRPLLPADVVAAGDDAVGRTELQARLKNLIALGQPCWRYDRSRVNLGVGEQMPEPVWSVARAESVAAVIDEALKPGEGQAKPTDDPERVTVLTVEWGIPAHALSAVRDWRAEYLRALQPEAGGRLTQPVHLDKRWNLDPESLEDFVPDYYGVHSAGDDLALGRFLDHFLVSAERGGDTAVLELFDVPAWPKGIRGPIFDRQAGRRREYFGLTLASRNGLFIPGREVSFGVLGPAQLPEALAPRVEVRSAVAALLEKLLAVKGEAVVEAMRSYRADVLEKELAAARGKIETDALDAEADAIVLLAEELATQLVRALPATRRRGGRAPSSRAGDKETTSK